MVLEPGDRVLERWLVERKLGEGGMGAVYRARHERLPIVAVVKVLLETQDRDLVDRFEREAALMTTVRHPNVVTIQDYGQLADGTPVMLMEFIEGEPLDRRLLRQLVVPWQTACDWMRDVLAGLEAMHAAHVLHRDMKPANLMVARATAEYVKIIDFGIAKRTTPDATQLTQAGGVVGTPAFMSPEQLYGYEIDERSDLYAVGLIWYQLLTGEAPTATSSATSIQRRISQTVPVPKAPGALPQVPTGVQDLVLALLAVDAARRPRSAREALERLQRAVSAPPIGATADATLVPRRVPEPGATRVAGAPPRVDATLLRVTSAPSTVDAEPAGRLGDVPTAPVLDESTPGPTAGTRRYLIAAKIPRSRLVRREERQWLAKLTGPGGRAFTFGAQIWFAWGTAPGTAAVAEREAEGLASEIEQRYGTSARVAYTTVGDDFAVTPAALSGAAPLPTELGTLVEDLSAAPD